MTDPVTHRAKAERALGVIDASDDPRNLPAGLDAIGSALLALHDLLDERLPKPEGESMKDEPTCITEDQPVGTYLVDRENDVWKRREDGWSVRWDGVWSNITRPFDYVHERYGLLRLATPADLARVGIEDEPDPADDLPGDRRVNVTITDVYAVPDEHGFLRINVGPEGATVDPDARNVTVTDVSDAPADDLPGEPVEPCGRDVGDATYCPCLLPRSHDGLHSCKHAEPAPADDLPGEPVEPGDLRAGDRVEFAWEKTGEDIACTLVNFHDGSALYSDVPDSGGYRPNVVWNGVWCHGITDVRLIERAPREDDDRDEALAMDLYHASLKIPPVSEIGPTAWDDATRQKWLDVARMAREHIEAERESRERTVVDEWDDMLARAENAEKALDNATQRVLALTAERDKWQAKWRESDEARERAEAERDDAARHADRWCERVHEMRDERDGWKVRCEKAEAALADERDRHDATITERDALRERLHDFRADVERGARHWSTYASNDPHRQRIARAAGGDLTDYLAHDDERAAKGGQR